MDPEFFFLSFCEIYIIFSITCHFKNLYNLIISFHIRDMKCFMVHDFMVNDLMVNDFTVNYFS